MGDFFHPGQLANFLSGLQLSVCLVTPLRSGCPPWATRLTFPFTMALSRGCSLPLMSPYGLPSAGSVGSHPPGCLTLRAAYAAYRATALLLGSQPAPAGMCSSFRFPVYVPLVFRGQNSAFNSPPPCSPCPRWLNPSTQKLAKWPGCQNRNWD